MGGTMKKILILALLFIGCDYAPTEHSHNYTYEHTHDGITHEHDTEHTHYDDFYCMISQRNTYHICFNDIAPSECEGLGGNLEIGTCEHACASGYFSEENSVIWGYVCTCIDEECDE